MSYAPYFMFATGEEPKTNATRFATEDEAEGAAADKFAVWTMTTGYFVKETPDDPVNYTWDAVNGSLSVKLN
jgi:hypothetical protein